jgi:hypothetical protein
MKTEKINRTTLLFSLLGSIGLLVWWFLMPIFLPLADSANDFQVLILDKDWIYINMIGLFATLLVTLGFPGFYLAKYKNLNRPGFTGLVLASAGLILFTGIQYYETLLWPAAAQADSELLKVEGELVSGNAGLVAGLLISGLVLGLGYILFGISALRSGVFPKIPVWFLIVGAPVFGNGILLPVRTFGLLLFCSGIIWLAILLLKENKYQKINSI